MKQNIIKIVLNKNTAQFILKDGLSFIKIGQKIEYFKTDLNYFS
jgi:hypothetical protein